LLSGARSANDLGVKVSLYMTCFEIMFSTETTELTHRLSERVAFFLFREPVDRIAAYRRMKRGYGIRSKVIHGSVLADSLQKELADASAEIDELLRQLVLKVASDSAARRVFEMDDNKLEDYFTRLAIGTPLPEI
jgi:Apea-like HEPN